MYLKFLCILFNVFCMVYSLRIACIKSGLSDFEVKTRRTWARVKETHPLNAFAQTHLNRPISVQWSQKMKIFSQVKIYFAAVGNNAGLTAGILWLLIYRHQRWKWIRVSIIDWTKLIAFINSLCAGNTFDLIIMTSILNTPKKKEKKLQVKVKGKEKK